MKSVHWFSIAVLGLAGCSSTPTQVEENPAASHLRKILQAYDLMLMEKHKAPQDVEELKPYLVKLNPNDDPEKFLRSPNDGEPYEIVWGVKLDQSTEYSAIIAYEKKGSGGIRQVITISRLVKPMTDEEFQNASVPKVKKSKS